MDIPQHDDQEPNRPRNNKQAALTLYRNVKSYRGADGDTDHYLVVADFSEKLSVTWRRKQQQKRSKKQIDWNKTKDSKELQKYQHRITKELNELRYSSTFEIELVWAEIKDTITETTSIFHEESRNPKKHWFDKACQDAIRNRNTYRLQMLQDTSEERIQTYKEARNLANSILRRQKKLAEKKAIEDTENYKANPRLFYKHCKSVKKGYKARNCTMSDNDGNLVTETHAITYLFKEHFEQLLNNIQELSLGDKYEQIIYDTVEPELLEPNLDEIKVIINSLKNNKLPEEDNINSELRKFTGPHLVIQLQKLIKSIWVNEQIPKEIGTQQLCSRFLKKET